MTPDIKEFETNVPSAKSTTLSDYKWQYRWFNIIAITTLAISSTYGIFLVPQANSWACVYSIATCALYGQGVTAGAHRLWTHRSFKAKWPLRLFLIILNTASVVGCVHNWARDHRVHHKYSETDADPHNSKRGFFFSHVGWLFCSKHPDVVEAGKKMCFDDLKQDPLVVFQKKYYVPLMISTVLVTNFGIPWYVWQESFKICFFVHFSLRYFYFLNDVWSVNSFAHMFGDRPYNSNIGPAENKWVSLFGMGEGYHNYHHSFPWDYATSEMNYSLNTTAKFIKLMENIGQAYDLRKASSNEVSRLKHRVMTDLHPSKTVIATGMTS